MDVCPVSHSRLVTQGSLCKEKVADKLWSGSFLARSVARQPRITLEHESINKGELNFMVHAAKMRESGRAAICHCRRCLCWPPEFHRIRFFPVQPVRLPPPLFLLGLRSYAFIGESTAQS